MERLEPITDGFVFHQLVKFCMNTWTQFMRSNITIPHQEKFLSAQHCHVDTVIANNILDKGTRCSLHQWTKDDYDLTVIVIQKPHTQGGLV